MAPRGIRNTGRVGARSPGLGAFGSRGHGAETACRSRLVNAHGPDDQNESPERTETAMPHVIAPHAAFTVPPALYLWSAISSVASDFDVLQLIDGVPIRSFVRGARD